MERVKEMGLDSFVEIGLEGMGMDFALSLFDASRIKPSPSSSPPFSKPSHSLNRLHSLNFISRYLEVFTDFLKKET